MDLENESLPTRVLVGAMLFFRWCFGLLEQAQASLSRSLAVYHEHQGTDPDYDGDELAGVVIGAVVGLSVCLGFASLFI